MLSFFTFLLNLLEAMKIASIDLKSASGVSSHILFASGFHVLLGRPERKESAYSYLASLTTRNVGTLTPISPQFHICTNFSRNLDRNSPLKPPH